MAADLRGGVLMDVDRHSDAGLLLRKAPLARLTVSMGKVRAVDARLVDLDAVALNDAVLVADDGPEHAMPPFERGGMGDPAVHGDTFQGHAHVGRLHKSHEGRHTAQGHRRELELPTLGWEPAARY